MEKDVESQPCDDIARDREVAVRQRIARHEERADTDGRRISRVGTALGDDEQHVIAGPRGSRGEQRCRAERDQSADLGGESMEMPARERQDAVRGEAIEKCPPCLHGVERMLGEHVRAGRARRKRIDERDLDDVEAPVQPRDVAAGLVVDELHRRSAIQVAGVGAERVVECLEDRFVHFDGNYLALAEGQSREHIPSAAGAHDQHAGVAAQVVGEVRDVVTEVVQCGR